tara:strand:+ start:315 stop:488 length:174 start_codon:yes stop_codon:yes gene_type:complete
MWVRQQQLSLVSLKFQSFSILAVMIVDFSQEFIDKTCLPARSASTNVPRAFIGKWRV